MVQSFSLQTRMITSFLFMGLIVLIVALIGLSATSKLSGHIAAIGGNSLPSISGLWKINEGQTQIQSSEQALLNPFLSKENQKLELTRIKETGKQIDEGLTEYNSAPKFPGEEELYQKFLKDWEIWKEKHNEFLRLYRQFEELGIANPITVQVQLLSQDQGNSPTMASAKTAAALLNKLSALSANEIRTSFESANNSLLDIVKLNYDMAKVAQKNSAEDVSRNTFWVWVGMIIGPISALVLGIYFSVTIAKPLGAKIAGIVNAIVSSSREIAITVEQQERTANQQASAVHQTTTTMNQLSASSNQSAQQAATATASARQALNQAEAGTKAVEETLVGMATLKEKVEAIAEQIKHLSEQTSLIGNISTVVSELANQTNMLALNAAVEAVRAGEHGRGFGIVAAEIRKLADQSKQSAHKINTLVTDIQNAINSTVIVTDQGTKTAETGARITQETAHAFTDIASAINGVFESSQQISQNAQQQAMAIQQVVDTMKALNQAAVETASGISQTKLSTQQLNEVALNLKALV